MIDQRRILVTGAGGQLGRAFHELLPDGVALPRSRLDIADLDALPDRLDEIDPLVIVNCAAYTAVDAAEDDEATATRINGDAVAVMSAWAAQRDRRFVTYSTDYVFSGDGVAPYTESSPTAPINAYGRSKRHGEVAALADSTSLVIRTSWLVSHTPPNFVATMLRLAGRNEPFTVVDDQHGCPTIAADLAAHTMAVVEAGHTGLLHASNRGVTTWFGLARAAVAAAGLDVTLLTPCTTAEFPTKARRPAYSVMDTERDLGVAAMPHWRSSLPSMVRRLAATI